MRPIRDIQDVDTGRVLYHSAFGFALVDSITPDGARLTWDGAGDNLPEQATHDVLQRVYALCPADGFFHRSVVDREGMAATLEEHPADALALLLGDLHKTCAIGWSAARCSPMRPSTTGGAACSPCCSKTAAS